MFIEENGRTRALDLCGFIQPLLASESVEIAVRAIALQAVIFERLDPALWDESLADAREGMKLARPETEN